MIKKLFFTAALLVPSLAYAGTPSATLPGQIASAGSDPAVPAGAAAAGFTTLALNADFSQSTYSNIATWVDGCGGPTSGNRWVYRWWNNNGVGPCGDLIMETDPTIGKQVLHLQYLPAYNAPGTNTSQQILVLSWPQIPFFDKVNYFPVEFYTEITYRMTAASLTQAHEVNNMSNYMVSGGLPSYSIIEPDFFEVIANSLGNGNGRGWLYGDGVLQEGLGLMQNYPYHLAADLTAYHTIGTLFTSDGNSIYYKCYYLDGTKLGCWLALPSNAPTVFAWHRYIFAMGWGTDSNNLANGTIINNMDIYVQSIRVWVCPNSFGTSTECAGTVINH